MHDSRNIKRKLQLGLCVGLMAVTSMAMAALANPLRAQVRTVFPHYITTVGEASDYLLKPLGYRLLTEFPAPPESQLIAKLEIPVAITARERVLTIEDVLLTMIGPENALIIDHANRLVSFSHHSNDVSEE